MLLYKKLNIDQIDKIQNDLLDLVNELFDYQDVTTNIIVSEEIIKNRCPLLIKFLAENNLNWDICRFFITKPQDIIPIHNDGNDQYPKFLALNIPVINCENTSMIWWDNVDPIASDLSSNIQRYGSNIQFFDSNNKIKVGSIELDAPYLVRINYPHNVENLTDRFRIIFSMRFNPEPLHLWN